MLAVYPENRIMVGHFGFESEYKNHINILGLNFTLDIERIFTIPEDLENKIMVQFSNVKKRSKLPKLIVLNYL